MADIFTAWKLKDLEIPNRIIRSATWEGMAEADGTPTVETVNLTAELAENGVGMIITGYAFVDTRGRGLPAQTGAHIDAMVGPLTRLSDAVHKSGGLVTLQIVHAGGQTRADWIGAAPEGPSAIHQAAFKADVEEMSQERIDQVIDAFAAAAARGKAAGFDAVQLHGAHGYLINQFLSPNTNLRTDAYGGAIENRARFGLEVLQACRQAVGPNFPLWIKLNTDDGLGEEGFQVDEAVAVAKMLDSAGIDGIEVSGGVPAAGKKSPARMVKSIDDEGYFLDNAKKVKAAVSCPVAVVGGFRSKAKVEEALDSVDAVSMARPFIRQPGLPGLWREGQADAATCISCGGCFKTGMDGGITCLQDQKEAAK